MDSSHSPYRDPTESRIRNHEERLAALEKERTALHATIVRQKAIIGSYELATRIGREYRKVKHAFLTTGIASLTSLSMAFGFVAGALCMLPAHATQDAIASASVANPPTMQAAPEPRRVERARLCLEEPPLRILRFDGYHVYWVEPFRKPDEFDLALWMGVHEPQYAFIAYIY